MALRQSSRLPPTTPPPSLVVRAREQQSPRLLERASLFDNPNNLLTPRSFSPPPGPSAAEKAAIAARNAKKLCTQLLAKANACSKTSGVRMNSRPSTSRKNDDFFGENDDDDHHKEETCGDARPDVDDEDYEENEEEEKHVGAEDADMVGRHRQVFMERAFSDDEEEANNNICRPQKEIDEIIFLLEHWEVDTTLKSVTDPDHFRILKRFHETHRKGYKWVKTYFLQYVEIGGNARPILRQKEDTHEKGGRIVVSREAVFDAIDEWHREKGHIGQERTHAFCRTKYYNCTQALVKIYCETCYVCMRKNPTVAPMKGSRKPSVRMAIGHASKLISSTSIR